MKKITDEKITDEKSHSWKSHSWKKLLMTKREFLTFQTMHILCTCRVARWYICKPKIHICVNFGGP
jgi:hypothetical protein